MVCGGEELTDSLLETTSERRRLYRHVGMPNLERKGLGCYRTVGVIAVGMVNVTGLVLSDFSEKTAGRAQDQFQKVSCRVRGVIGGGGLKRFGCGQAR
jgi:hypothetical protein